MSRFIVTARPVSGGFVRVRLNGLNLGQYESLEQVTTTLRAARWTFATEWTPATPTSNYMSAALYRQAA